MYCFTGTFSKDLNKMIYLQNRRYLQCNDDLRSDTVDFPERSVESHGPPSIRNYSEMKSLHEAYECISAKQALLKYCMLKLMCVWRAVHDLHDETSAINSVLQDLVRVLTGLLQCSPKAYLGHEGMIWMDPVATSKIWIPPILTSKGILY